MNNFHPSSYTSAHDPFSALGGYDDGMSYDMMVNSLGTIGSSENKILELQNFLRTPPLALFNLIPSPDSGEVTFTANLKPYTQLFILAIDQNSVA